MPVDGGRAYRYSISWKLYRKLQRKGWFSCSSILLSLMIFRTLSDRTTASRQSLCIEPPSLSSGLTLIFTDIFQSKRQAGIFALHDPDFPECTFSHYA